VIEGEKNIKKSLSLLPKVADALSFSNRHFQERRCLIQKIAILMSGVIA
jgi:hypothetical protein